MNADLEAIREAWDPGDPETKNADSQRDEDRTRTLADAYVAAHPDKFTEFADLSQEQCVQALEVFRAAAMEESEWTVQVWLFHRFEPQNIGGAHHSIVRIPTNG